MLSRGVYNVTVTEFVDNRLKERGGTQVPIRCPAGIAEGAGAPVTLRAHLEEGLIWGLWFGHIEVPLRHPRRDFRWAVVTGIWLRRRILVDTCVCGCHLCVHHACGLTDMYEID